MESPRAECNIHGEQFLVIMFIKCCWELVKEKFQVILAQEWGQVRDHYRRVVWKDGPAHELIIKQREDDCSRLHQFIFPTPDASFWFSCFIEASWDILKRNKKRFFWTDKPENKLKWSHKILLLSKKPGLFSYESP